MVNQRFILTLSPRLKRDLAHIAEDWGCSQAEVIKAALERLIEREEAFK